MKNSSWPHRACLAFGVILGLATFALGALLLPLVFREEFAIPHGIVAAVLMVLGGIVASDCWRSLHKPSASTWVDMLSELATLDRKRGRFPDEAAVVHVSTALEKQDY